MDKDHNQKLSRRAALKVIGATSVGLSLSSAVAYAYSFHIEPHWLAVENIPIRINNLPSEFAGYKIVCMADFHHEASDQLNLAQRIVRITNQLRPDMICLLGDYVFSDAESIYALAGPLGDLEAPDGVYAVLGNHDYWTDADTVIGGLQQAGVTVLINQVVMIERGDQTLLLVGIDDGWSGSPDPAGTLQWIPPDTPVIAIMHEPDFADAIAALEQVDLQLSGHSHGGQVKPLFLEAPFLPEYARKFVAGLYQVNRLQLYVTRGVGTIPPRARFNCRPEITEVVLIPADQASGQ